MLRVEMLSTGDEVLHGQIIDTNAAWLADYLFQQGVPMSGRETVGDSLSALIEILQERSHIADVLIVNGGLGPTSDDLSALAAAKACGVELVERADWLARMEAYFAERGRPMAPSNRKQAQIPANAEMLDNPVGTACGFALQLNKCQMFFTPGVPSEFKVMVEQQIVPRLRQRFTLPPPPLCLRLTTFGTSESDLAAELDGMPLPPEVVLGYRSSSPIIELKLTGPESRRAEMEQAWRRVREVAGDNCIFEGTAGLPAMLTQRLNQQGLKLALSEQFSAGVINLQLQSEGRRWRGRAAAGALHRNAGNDAGARPFAGGIDRCAVGVGGQRHARRAGEHCAAYAARRHWPDGALSGVAPRPAAAAGVGGDAGAGYAAPLA